MYLVPRSSKQHCSTPKRKRPRALESKLGPLIPPADAVALGHGTHFVLVEPFMGMVSMEPVVAIDTKGHEALHVRDFCGFARISLCVGGSSPFRHGVCGPQPHIADSTARHVSTAPGTHSSRQGRRSQRVADGRMHCLRSRRRGDLRGCVVLGHWAGTVIANQTDLLRWRRNELAPIHRHRQLAISDVKLSTLNLHLPGVHLAAIGLAPGVELSDEWWVTDDAWDGVAHG